MTVLLSACSLHHNLNLTRATIITKAKQIENIRRYRIFIWLKNSDWGYIMMTHIARRLPMENGSIFNDFF